MLVVGVAFMALLAPSAGARSTDARAAPALPRSLWALELRGSAAVSSSALRSYRAQGFNAVLTRSRRTRASLRRRASGARMLHLRARAAKPAACRALKRRYGRCVLTATSLRAALRLARSRAVNLVVVRLGNLGELQSLSGRSRGRILAIGRLDGEQFDLGAWTEAAVLATNDPMLDLGVSASSARRGVAAQRFGTILRESRRPKPPPPPPPPPPRHHRHRHHRHRHRHRHRRHPRPAWSAPTPSTRAQAARPLTPRATATTARSTAPAGRPRAATAPPSRWTAPATGSQSPMPARST